MTQPSEEEVRAWLLQLTRSHPRPGPLAARALALLDEGEKDRERLDWLETTGCYVTVSPTEYVAAKLPGFRAAIDQARGA